MANRITTLFIEDTAIRFLVAKGNHAEKWASVPLETGLVEHGVVQDEAILAAKLKETFQWAKLSERVTLGLSEPGSLYRIITLPKLPEAIIPEAVKREAERVIPLSQDEIYLAHQVISTTEEEIQLFLAAFSRHAVDTLINTLQMAGIKPASLDLVPLSLCRVADKDTAIIVSLRSSNFEIAVMVDRIPQVIRSLSLPGHAESIEDKLPMITEELERTVTFYNSSHTEKQLDETVPVFVDGELVQEPETWSSLVMSLGSPVSAFPTIMHTEEQFEASEYNVNIGLALPAQPEGGTGSLISFNALPQAYQPPKPSLMRVLVPILIGLAVIALFYIGIQTQTIAVNLKQSNAELELKQQQIVKTNEEMGSLKEQIQETTAKIQPLEEQMATVDGYVITFDNLYTSLYESRLKAEEATAEIVALLPQNVVLQSIDYSTAIVIEGQTADEDDIFKYSRAIKDSEMFHDWFTSFIIRSINLEENSLEVSEDIYEDIYSFQLIITPEQPES